MDSLQGEQRAARFNMDVDTTIENISNLSENSESQT